MDLQIEGKAAAVAAASVGLGFAVARQLALEGAHVGICSRSEENVEAAAERIAEESGREVFTHVCDLSDSRQAVGFVDAVDQKYGALDILVTNAGFMFEQSLDEMQIDDWNRMLAVNLTAPVFLSKHLLPLMRANGGGSIIHIGSIEGLAANPEHAAYCASKGGVHALTRAMAVDLGGDAIRVNAIAPGWIRSGLSDNYIDSQPDPGAAWEGLYKMHPLGRIGEPGDVGQLAVFLASDASAFVTGQIIVIDGGRTARLPLPF